VVKNNEPFDNTVLYSVHFYIHLYFTISVASHEKKEKKLTLCKKVRKRNSYSITSDLCKQNLPFIELHSVSEMTYYVSSGTLNLTKPNHSVVLLRDISYMMSAIHFLSSVIHHQLDNFHINTHETNQR